MRPSSSRSLRRHAPVCSTSKVRAVSLSRFPCRSWARPVAPIPPTIGPAAAPTLQASLSTPTSVSSWFGGAKHVTLVLRVTNVSGFVLPKAVVTVNVGRGANPTNFAAGTSLSGLPVGATRVVHIPLSIPAVTYGRYTIRASVATVAGNSTTQCQRVVGPGHGSWWQSSLCCSDSSGPAASTSQSFGQYLATDSRGPGCDRRASHRRSPGGELVPPSARICVLEHHMTASSWPCISLGD